LVDGRNYERPHITKQTTCFFRLFFGDLFALLHQRRALDTRSQPEGHLGQRMAGAMQAHFKERPAMPWIVIGTDCPVLTPQHLQAMADALAAYFRREAYTDGIVAAVAKAGELLSRHFPRSHDDRNELPDSAIEHPPVI
jgi:hypothetical protein